MWLPETAVDTASLEELAAQGIAFTLLAPRQASRVRGAGGPWRDITEATLDKTRAYRVRLSSGRDIAVFFYDGGLARAVAFEQVLRSGEELAHRLVAAAGGGDGPRLGHIATDGESYGHHHRFGEMALAYALRYIETDDLAELTNYGRFLELAPPVDDVELAQPTSWSCEHGIERWRADCGCKAGEHPQYVQTWRAPLRVAMDWLSERLAQRFETSARPLLLDPWAARDAYIDVIHDPSAAERVLSEQAHRTLDATERETALGLLEMQRQALLMFASCAWFFEDVAGIETVQALRHAAKAIDLSQRHCGPDDTEQRLLRLLAAAPSNDPKEGNGALVYQRHAVRPDLRS